MNRPRTVESLLSELRCYTMEGKEVIKSHVHSLTGEIKLLPSIGKFVRNDGTEQTLLKVSGTIPIHYQNAQYHIPVKIWFPHNYPFSAPICFVDPTKDMAITLRHPHVDPSGRVSLYDLERWSPRSSLLQLVIEMASAFSKVPPVFAKPPGHVQPPVNNHPYGNPNQQDWGWQQPPVHEQPQQHEPPINSNAAKKDRLVVEVTEKLKRALRDYQTSTTTEIDSLFDKQSQLEKGSADVDAGVDSMKRESSLLSSAVADLVQQISYLEDWLSKNETDEAINVDEVVNPSDKWSEQLLNEVASDRAIDDTMYQLERGLINDDVSCDLVDFLKLIRRLSRNQFHHRALAIKVAEAQRLEAQAQSLNARYI